jgi:hypothetical protein
MKFYQDDYPPGHKAMVALEAVSSAKLLPFIALDYGRIEVELVKLWKQQLLDHKDNIYSAMSEDTYSRPEIDYVTDLFARLAAEDDSRLAELELQREQEYTKYAAILEQRHREADLPFAFRRYWSTDSPITTYALITGLLMHLGSGDLSKACDLFGVDTVLFVLEGVRQMSQKRRNVILQKIKETPVCRDQITLT